MRAHCEAVTQRVQQHMNELSSALAESHRRAADAAHPDVPPLRRSEVPCLVETPLAKLLGVVRLIPSHAARTAHSTRSRTYAAKHASRCAMRCEITVRGPQLMHASAQLPLAVMHGT